MSRTFIFLTLLFVSSYCIERKAANINQIVDELVELNKKIATPKDSIGTIVAQIGSAVRDSSRAFKGFYTDLQRNCASGQGYINDFANKLKGDLIAAQTGINDSNKAIAHSDKDAAEYAKQIKSGKAALRAAHVRHEKEKAAFAAVLMEADLKQLTIKHVRDIIEDELLNGKAPTLLQVNTITEKLTELKGMLEKSNDNMFSVVVGSLLETISEQNLNNQTVLRNILNTLAKIRKNLLAWRKKAIATNKQIRKTAKQTAAARLKALRALGRLLVEARSAKTNAQRNIQELNAAVAHLNNALKRKTRELKHWNALCTDQARIALVFRNGRTELKNHVKKVSAALLNLH
jgi:hypothetical protein